MTTKENNMIYTDGIHLISDTSEEELHTFAEKAGIKRCWFHMSKFRHYDIPKRRREGFAETHGITTVSSRQIVTILKNMPSPVDGNGSSKPVN